MNTIIPTPDQALRIASSRFGLTQAQTRRAFTERGMIFQAIKGAHGLDAATEWQRAEDAKAVAA